MGSTGVKVSVLSALFAGVFEAAIDGAEKALAETPELLPQLKKAGVVDAGGYGFVLILKGMYSVFKDGIVIASNSASNV